MTFFALPGVARRAAFLEKPLGGATVQGLTREALITGAERFTVRIETRFREGMVVLRVQDNGPGLDKESLPHLFDPFAPPRADLGGAELGLAVTHQLVSRHRGRIDVETSAQGTSFSVELPPAPLDLR